VVAQLKKTSYKPKVVVLASREHSCLHERVKVMQGGDQIAECKKLTKANSCAFFANLSKDSGADVQALLPPVSDIEDIVEVGKKHQLCPYFMARNRLETADMIFMPYSYVADPFLRRLHQSILQGAVLVFDEGHFEFEQHYLEFLMIITSPFHSSTGHNIAEVAAEAASFSINTETIAVAIRELDKCIKVTDNAGALSSAISAGAAAGMPGACSLFRSSLIGQPSLRRL
jgi:Rad3-related DNA helicase